MMVAVNGGIRLLLPLASPLTYQDDDDDHDDDDQVDDRLGGAPANVACALARLGTKTAFLGRLGQDTIGMILPYIYNIYDD